MNSIWMILAFFRKSISMDYRKVKASNSLHGLRISFPYHMDSIAVYDGANDENHRIISAVVPHGDKEKWLEMAAKLRTMHAARVMLASAMPVSVARSPGMEVSCTTATYRVGSSSALGVPCSGGR